MKVIDFLKKKNKLVFKATGIVLIPEDQLIDLVPRRLDFRTDATICPYCVEFIDDICDDCPMSKASNKCTEFGGDDGTNDDSYARVKKELDGNGIGSVAGVVDLVKRFNESNGFSNDNLIRPKTISAMNKKELLYFIEEYNEYTGRFFEDVNNNSFKDIYDFHKEDFQDILEDEENNKEESM